MDNIVARLGRTKFMQGADIETLCDEAAEEIKRLRDAIDTLLNAINTAGPVPKHHIQVAAKHREEWPTLWKAIDQLREARNG